MWKTVSVGLLALVVSVVLVGCKSQPQMTDRPQTGVSSEPQWVTKAGSAFPEDKGKAIFGVGVAEGKAFPLIGLRRRTAVERGKTEVAGQLRTFVQSVYKEYSESCFTPSAKTGEAQQLIQTATKSIIDETLVGCEIKDSWVNPNTGDEYALMRLSMDNVVDQMRQKMLTIEKDRLVKKADDAHKELDDIIAKNRQRSL
jgi:hypothetical protein